MVDFGTSEPFVRDLIAKWRRSDYEGLDEAVAAADREKMNFAICALHLSSLVRLGRIKDAGAVGQSYEAMARGHHWDQVLMGLTTGRLTLPAALSEAATHPDELRAMAWASIRLDSLGLWEEAKAWRFLAFAPRAPWLEREILQCQFERHKSDAYHERLVNRLLRMATDLYALERFHEGLVIAERARVMARMKTVSQVTNAQVLRMLGRLYKAVGDFDLSRPYQESAATILRQQLTDQDPLAFEALLDYADELNTCGHWDEALPLWQALAANAEAAGSDNDVQHRVKRGLASALLDTGHLQGAVEAYEDLLQSAEEEDPGYDLTRLAHAYLELGQADRALLTFTYAHRWRIEERRFGALSFFDIAKAHHALGDEAAADEQVAGGMAFIREQWVDDTGEHAQQLRLAADALRRLGRTDEAVVAYRDAVALARDSESAWEQLLSLHDLAVLEYEQGHEEHARSLLGQGMKVALSRGEDGAYWLRRIEGALKAIESGRAPPSWDSEHA